MDLRWRKRLGQVQIGGRLAVPNSTGSRPAAARYTETHSPVPAANQRKRREVPPHPGRWLGLRPPLRIHHRAHSALGGQPPVTRL